MLCIIKFKYCVPLHMYSHFQFLIIPWFPCRKTLLFYFLYKKSDWLFKVCKQCHLLSVCSQHLKMKTWQTKLIQNLDGKEEIWRFYNLETKCTTSLNTCKRLSAGRPHWAGLCERQGGMISYLSSHSNTTVDQEEIQQKQGASDYNESGTTWSKVK